MSQSHTTHLFCECVHTTVYRGRELRLKPLKRVEIGLVSEACPILPAAIYFVRLPSYRLQNSRFFSLGKAWRKSYAREAREPHTPVGRVRRVRNVANDLLKTLPDSLVTACLEI